MLASLSSTQGESDFPAQRKPNDSIRSDFALVAGILCFLDRLFAGANRMKRTFGCQSGLALLHHPHPAPLVLRPFRAEELSDWMTLLGY